MFPFSKARIKSCPKPMRDTDLSLCFVFVLISKESRAGCEKSNITIYYPKIKLTTTFEDIIDIFSEWNCFYFDEKQSVSSIFSQASKPMKKRLI